MFYRTSFVDVETTVIAQDLLESNFIRGHIFASCMRHVRVRKFFMSKSTSSEYFKSSAASAFGLTHLIDKVEAFYSDSDVFLLLDVASAYL